MTAIVRSWEDIKFNSFDEGELALVKWFHEQIIQIYESSFIKNGSFKSDFAITFSRASEKIEMKFDSVEEANIRSILLLVRPLARANDETSIRIEKILSILKYKSANDETRMYIQTITRNFHNRKSSDTNPTIMVRGLKEGSIKDYTEEDIIELWVNGYYFHKDSSKRKELDDLEHFMSEVNMKPVLKSILLHEIMDICEWAKLVDEILVNTILSKK